MISWIQRTFQHHFKLIFSVLLVGMVIPFIFTIGSTPGVGRADRGSATRDYFGHNMLSQQEFGSLMNDTRLSAELQFGTVNATEEQLTHYMYQRVACQHLADQLHIPPASPSDVTDYIKRLRIFQGADGAFDVTRYEQLRSSLGTGSGPNEAQVARIIGEDARIFKVSHLLAGPGYAVPSDVSDVLKKSDTVWTVSTATIPYATFPAGPAPTDAEVAKYFADNSFRYTIAPQVSADYVQFTAAGFAAQQQPTDAQVRDLFDTEPGRFPSPAPKAGVKADPNADFAAAKAQVRAALVDDMSRRAAVKAASDLAYALYEGKVTRDQLGAFLSARGFKAQPLAPFTADAGPAELGGSKQISSAAFELGSDRFYSEALPSPAGAVVLIWNSLQPARQPAFAEVRAKVIADAAENQKRIRFVEFGRTFRASVEGRLQSGEPFARAVAGSEGPVKVEVKSYPPFTLQSQPKDVDPVALQALESLKKGSVSEMQATADKGVLVYAADMKVPAIDDSSARYAQLHSQIAASYAAADEMSITREYVDDELKRADLAAAK
ncbi:MAG TPA: peptidyl-prolyl cis-trans isomerase [Opitutaceae bacterium]|jgi:peptidyl-prolyl cis-trans isomerase D